MALSTGVRQGIFEANKTHSIDPYKGESCGRWDKEPALNEDGRQEMGEPRKCRVYEAGLNGPLEPV